MTSLDANHVFATFRVGEKGRVNLPAQLRQLAHIEEGDLLVVTKVSNGEVTFRTPAAIRDFIHSGIVEGEPDGSVADWRRADDEAGKSAMARKLDADDPDAGDALLRAVGL
jgi:AbrB family looped-hinge helix DNA binding protein